MAKDKKDDKAKGAKAEEKPVKTKGNGLCRLHIFLIFVLLSAIIFLPTTVLMFVGLLPTIAAALFNFDNSRSKIVGIGAMNMAGVTPFLIDLWKQGQEFTQTVEIITNPQAITVMYAAAALGYMVNWAMTGIVGSVLFEAAKVRRREIEKRRSELIERWGEEVTGTIALDQQGFPIAGVSMDLAEEL